MPQFPRSTYIRFEVSERHRRSGVRIGLLHAIRYLRDDGLLNSRQIRAASAVFDWYADHLASPSKSTFRVHPRAVSWFHHTSTQHLRRIERLATIAEAHDIRVIRRNSMTPGRIVYRDDVQVLAVARRRKR
jgi:hypothetical protein